MSSRNSGRTGERARQPEMLCARSPPAQAPEGAKTRAFGWRCLRRREPVLDVPVSMISEPGGRACSRVMWRSPGPPSCLREQERERFLKKLPSFAMERLYSRGSARLVRPRRFAERVLRGLTMPETRSTSSSGSSGRRRGLGRRPGRQSRAAQREAAAARTIFEGTSSKTRSSRRTPRSRTTSRSRGRRPRRPLRAVHARQVLKPLEAWFFGASSCRACGPAEVRVGDRSRAGRASGSRAPGRCAPPALRRSRARAGRPRRARPRRRRRGLAR